MATQSSRELEERDGFASLTCIRIVPQLIVWFSSNLRICKQFDLHVQGFGLNPCRLNDLTILGDIFKILLSI